jgi:subfamily B ATP-binding cassette protein MsbA
LGNPPTDSELQQVAKISKITEFISDLPDGFNTILGDDGIKLSGGQRQRVALARALFNDEAEILILDEATSDLDSNLEREIHNELVNLDEEWTVFAIAHRLSTVQDADRIYTIEEGKITETGTHRELVESNGKYAELYEVQS